MIELCINCGYRSRIHICLNPQSPFFNQYAGNTCREWKPQVHTPDEWSKWK
jgi:hypothetical protein